MSLISRLIDRLHRIFNKDPQAYPVITLGLTSVYAGEMFGENSGNIIDGGSFGVDNADTVDGGVWPVAYTVSLGNGTMDILLNGRSVLGIDYSTLTLTGLVNAINAVPSYVATLAPGVDGSLLAIGLVEDSYIDDGVLLYPASLLHKEYQTYGLIFQQQADHIDAANLQLYMHTAEDRWLDYWGELFGIPRYNGETDALYGQRIIYEVTRPTQNNVALQIIVRNALGYDVRIKDAQLFTDDLDPADVSKAVGRFILDMAIPASYTPEQVTVMVAKIRDIVRKYKAAGTDFLDVAPRKLTGGTEVVSVYDGAIGVDISAGFTEGPEPGPIYFGAGWVNGAPGLVHGTNDAMKEQAVVKRITASDGTINWSVYGG